VTRRDARTRGGGETRAPRRSRHVPIKLRHAISAMPCAICGGTEDVCTDHIIPYSLGGTSDPSNLQPLCWLCNIKKGNRLTNDELLAWFEANREEITLRHEYRRATRYRDPFTCLPFDVWKRSVKAPAQPPEL
jgi:5-methylcytosine-specific restriction endonuclease McrA